MPDEERLSLFERPWPSKLLDGVLRRYFSYYCFMIVLLTLLQHLNMNNMAKNGIKTYEISKTKQISFDMHLQIKSVDN